MYVLTTVKLLCHICLQSLKHVRLYPILDPCQFLSSILADLIDYLSIEANTVDQDQTAPTGSTMFALDASNLHFSRPQN